MKRIEAKNPRTVDTLYLDTDDIEGLFDDTCNMLLCDIDGVVCRLVRDPHEHSLRWSPLSGDDTIINEVFHSVESAVRAKINSSESVVVVTRKDLEELYYSK